MNGEPFTGFVTGGSASILPAQLFVELFPEIDDEAELRVTLYALYAIGRRRGELRAIRGSELSVESPLVRSLEHIGGDAVLASALERAVSRGSLLSCSLDDGETLYFVNSEGGRRNLLRVRSGAIEVPGAAPVSAPPRARLTRPAEVYENEIGALSPTIADALLEATERYPQTWVVDALQLAAKNNARSWRYAEAILRRWEAEGRDNETIDGDPGETEERSSDPYAQVIRRSWP